MRSGWASGARDAAGDAELVCNGGGNGEGDAESMDDFPQKCHILSAKKADPGTLQNDFPFPQEVALARQNA